MLAACKSIFTLADLRSKVLFTLGMLAIYRLGAHIPLPGIDSQALADFFASQGSSLLNFLDMFSGGALGRVTLFALGIVPYISASIIIQLLTVVVPTLEKLNKDPEGRKKVTEFTRYGTVALAFVQGWGVAIGMQSMQSPDGSMVVMNSGISFQLMTALSLTAGTTFLMWMGEQITEKGVGNGISLLIFAGIVTAIPGGILSSIALLKSGEMSVFFILALVFIALFVTAAIVFIERGQRKIPVTYAKRMIGNGRPSGSQSTYIPLKVNTAGVIPVIFASSIIVFPITLAEMLERTPAVEMFMELFAPGGMLYTLFFVGFIIFFCFFYTAIIFNTKDVSENLKRNGGYIPSIRPGSETSYYLDNVLSRLTLGGAIYLSAVSIMPTFLIKYMSVPFYFGGTALLIIVVVGMDTMNQIESHLLARSYDGFLAKRR
ncbi:preprotein translocase subunit SecY [Chrysiogenes arsenatis]|uniref:preprotein translocase subunit SecY n=1 Tax=Chrysiogenes arsenatis TaxID=309797 RepID=UPI000488B6FC|nr:preprotein translocase subunit SecY [Chrysiogenes arsenatis]